MQNLYFFQNTILLKGMLLSGALSLMTACGTSSATHDQNKVEASSVETIKSGAGVSLSYDVPEAMPSGLSHALTLQFEEAYADGDMQVELTVSEGLQLFGGSTQKTFLMSGQSIHDWPIDVSADDDGIYFLSVFAQVSNPQTSEVSHRSFSIRFDIGEITPAMRAKAFPENGILSEDGKTRVLTATETIR